MTAERRRSSRWRRLGVKLIVSALAAPILAVAAGDLWLCSPWGRNWIGTKISRRLGLTVKVGPSLWTPWSGVVVHGIEIEPPDELRDSFEGPVLKTGDIRVDPNWTQSLRGKPAIESVCVEDPDLTLSPGLLFAIAAARKSAEPPEVASVDSPEHPPSLEYANPAPVLPPPPPFPDPEIAAGTPGQPAVSPTGAPSVPAGESSSASLPPVVAAPPLLPRNPPLADRPVPTAEASKSAAVQPPAAPATAAPSPESSTVMPSAEVDSRPPMVIEVRRGHFRMLGSQEGREPVAEISDFSLRLPVQGHDADGSVSIRSAKLAGRPLVENLAFSMKWQAPEIQIEQQHFKFAGADLEVSLRLARLPGFPFMVELKSPAQALPLWEGPLDRKISSRQIEGVVRAAGLLPAPASWQGVGAARIEDLRIEGEERTLRFTRGSCAVFFGGGILRCSEARLIGDDFSLLGNAVGGLDRSVNAAVFRWVAHPDVVRNWVEKVQATDPGLKVVVLPLETPERVMIDFSWVASGETPGVELGAGGSVVPLPVFLSFFGH